MPGASPTKVQEYSAEFKLAVVRLSRRRGVQVQAVAAALDIHPFMLSRWRRDVREARLRGRRGAAVQVHPHGRSAGCRPSSARMRSCKRSMPS